MHLIPDNISVDGDGFGENGMIVPGQRESREGEHNMTSKDPMTRERERLGLAGLAVNESVPP